MSIKNWIFDKMPSENDEDIGEKILEEIDQMEKKAFLIKDPEIRQKCLRATKKIREILCED